MSCEAAPPAACLLCQVPATRRRRRGLCVTCYRKLLACGIALPRRATPGPPPRSTEERLRALLRDVAPAHRAALRAILAEREAAP